MFEKLKNTPVLKMIMGPMVVKKREESTGSQKPTQEKPEAIPEIDPEMLKKAKEVLLMSMNKLTVLSHTQLHLICVSYGLVMRHYTSFVGKMPPEKIFAMPILENKYKIYVCSECYVGNWKIGGVSVSPNTAKHGRYYSYTEMKELKRHWSKIDKRVDFSFREEAPIFILAPEVLFGSLADQIMDRGLDPIIVERVGDDEYRVQSFWNVPEKLAVNLVDPINN